MICMKKIFIYTVICLTTFFNAVGQDVKFRTKLFSLKDPRFSLGAGVEAGGLFRFLNNTDRETSGSNAQQASFLYGASRDFDIYSPHSKVGLYFPINGYISRLRFNRASSKYSEFSLSNLELPLYLKFRLGARDARNYLWCALGASYDFRSATLVSVDSPAATRTNYRTLFKNNINVGAILGWEFSKNDSSALTRKWRTVAFVRANYSLQNILSKDFSNIGNETALGEYGSSTHLNYLTVSAGVKFFFRFPKKAPSATESEEINEENTIEETDKEDKKDKKESTEKPRATPWK